MISAFEVAMGDTGRYVGKGGCRGVRIERARKQAIGYGGAGAAFGTLWQIVDIQTEFARKGVNQ